MVGWGTAVVAKVKDGNEGGAAGRQPQRIKKTAPEPEDGIFQRSGGQLTLTVTEGSDGYVANFDIGLDMT